MVRVRVRVRVRVGVRVRVRVLVAPARHLADAHVGKPLDLLRAQVLVGAVAQPQLTAIAAAEGVHLPLLGER